MDDVGGIEDIGVLRAIQDYNAQSSDKKLRPAMYWQARSDPYNRGWKIYDHHIFGHPDYSTLIRTQTNLN